MMKKNNVLTFALTGIALVMSSPSFADGCCNYGYTQQEILNSHVIFLKDDPFFKVSIDQLNYADDTKAEATYSSLGLGREVRKSSHYWYWDVFAGQGLSSDGNKKLKINYSVGGEAGIGYRYNKINLGLSIQSSFDSIKYNNSQTDGVSIGGGVQLGYNFTNDFYLGYHYEKTKNFDRKGIDVRINF